MKLDAKTREAVALACERLFQKVREAHGKHPVKLGETSAKRPKNHRESDPLVGKIFDGWLDLIEPENSELDKLLVSIVKDAPGRNVADFAKLTPDKVWVWGGPTPYWGGSMADDTLVRGADYFGARNVVYVYGPTTKKMLKLHSKYDRMLCQINANCRTPGAQKGGDRANAELLSRLSLEFPNIVGGMCDDVSVSFEKVVLPETFKIRYDALKKYNDKLKMYGVIYAHELDCKDYSRILPYLDVVNLWFWRKEDILEFDERFRLARRVFGGKPVLAGIFLHDYGRSDAGAPPELLRYQLDRVRHYVGKGQIEGIVLLGDREIKKWPESSNAVRNYLLNQ